MRAKDRTGLVGEETAADFLARRGHSILARRWRCASGELDLITLDGDELVAVEVKTRRGIGYGHPFEAVTDQKLRRLHRLLAEYAATAQSRQRWQRWPLQRRVDVVSVLMLASAGGPPEMTIEHLRDV